MSIEELKPVVEGILFASERPLPLDEIRKAFDGPVDNGDLESALSALKIEYESQNRGFRLLEIAGGYQLVTDPRLSEYLKRLYQSRLKKRLTQATLETLSVIAYRQPVTRADIEFIRGVNIDGALKTLLERGLVRIVGRKEVPGRPMLYGTTPLFLEHFGLHSLKDLPSLSEYSIKDLDPNLLPPELREPVTVEETGEQKPVGCSNEPEDEKSEESQKETS